MDFLPRPCNRPAPSGRTRRQSAVATDIALDPKAIEVNRPYLLPALETSADTRAIRLR